jgi:drug/metabolite transporter (DMT)-like permease
LDARFLGELAALGAAFCWSFSSIFFTIGGRRVGALVVNRARLVLAVLLVGTTHWLLYGHPFPTDAGGMRYLWLTLSAIVGLVIGDSMLFQAYVLIGARLGVLLLSLSPLWGTLLAWIFLGERLTFPELAAMAIALAGVAWVVLERGKPRSPQDARGPGFTRGILYGLGAGLCQATGLVLSKPALSDGFPALSAVMIRMSVAMVVLWAWAAVRGEAGPTIRRLRADRGAAAAVFGGAFMGPFIGVWLSLIAVQTARVGIASTLMAMSPVLSLPLVHWFFGERASPRAILGTLIAMSGVILIILV